MNNYRKKYLKYREKYLSLKNEIIGGSIITAEKEFIKKFDIQIIREDEALIKFIENNVDDFVIKKEKENDELNNKIKMNKEELKKQIEKFKDNKNLIEKRIEYYKKENDKILEEIQKNEEIIDMDDDIKPITLYYLILEYLLTNYNKQNVLDNIDFFIKCYLSRSIGIPNSIKNFNIFLEAVNSFKLLKNKNVLTDDSNLLNYIGLNGNTDKHLERILLKYKEILDDLQLEKEEEEEIKKGMELILDIKNGEKYVKVYNILTKEAAISCGKHTKWCTAAEISKNRYNYYKSKGNLYMIQIKNKKNDPNETKYEIHFETEQLKDPRDNDTSISHILEKMKEIDTNGKFIEWLISNFYNKKTQILKYGLFDYDFNEISSEKLKHIKKINFTERFNIPLGNLFDKFIMLSDITFGEDFNQPLDNSLNKLTDLKTLTFGKKFNQSLNQSLNNLKKLEKLTFGDNFNESLEDSLNNLENLRELTFGIYFNKSLGNSLNNLTKLEILNFGNNFNKSLEDSLNNLKNLKKLIFGFNFNQQLTNELNNLQNLEELTFGYDFNQPLGDSLNNIIKLKKLTFGYKFNQPLNNSLDRLIELTDLTFGKNFNQSLETSLKKLKKLVNIDFTDI